MFAFKRVSFFFYHLYFVFNFIFPWRNSVVSEPFKEHSVLFLWFVMWPLLCNTCPYKINLLLTFISHSLCLFACLPIVMTWTLYFRYVKAKFHLLQKEENYFSSSWPCLFFFHMIFFGSKLSNFMETLLGFLRELYLISN